MSICCPGAVDSLYTAVITTSEGLVYIWEVENPTVDPTTRTHETRANSRAITPQRKRSQMTMTLTTVNDLDERLGGEFEGGVLINSINPFAGILGACGVRVRLQSECGSTVIEMVDATEDSGSFINLSENTVDVTFSSPREVRIRSFSQEINNITS